jgi:hypothetical protein
VGFDDAPLPPPQAESNVTNEKTNIANFKPLFIRPFLNELIPAIFPFSLSRLPSCHQKRPLRRL